MASPTKITKAVRARKVNKKVKNYSKQVRKVVAERMEILKAIETAVQK